MVWKMWVVGLVVGLQFQALELVLGALDQGKWSNI